MNYEWRIVIYLLLLHQKSMLELHDVIIKPRQQTFSLMVEDGKLACISGPQGSGKTSVLRAIMGLLPIDSGHISIDGELLTPRSAPYFRRHMAYVPSRLMPIPGQDTVDDVRRLLFSLRSSGTKQQEGGADGRRWSALTLTEQYLELLTCAAQLQRSIVLVDQPPCELDDAAVSDVLSLLQRMTDAGASVVVVSNSYHIKMNSQTLIEF